MEEPPWKKLKLSLERPYKDDNGSRIPVLLDITPEGQHIYETKESASVRLGDNLRRIFVERGVDFFERRTPLQVEADTLDVPGAVLPSDDREDGEESPSEDGIDGSAKPMTVEELYKMRMEILPQLFVALGEMSHARDLLVSLLSSKLPQMPDAGPSIPPLSATLVTKPPPIISVQAFNAQLSIGSKDEALRKAAGLFKSATESMERGRIRGEKYWVDALKIRRANWGLSPAPLPFGSSTGKGSDKTSKDFLISYGLEESPPAFRRRAIGHMAAYNTESDDLVFPHRHKTRLCVTLTTTNESGIHVHATNNVTIHDQNSLDGVLRCAQQEIVEQEIFSILVKESGSLPTASARVSERLIVIDAAQAVELKFELMDAETIAETSEETSLKEICDLIYNCLRILLLQRHGHAKEERLGATGVTRPQGTTTSPLPILQPIIDLLQYQVFCERIASEVNNAARALDAAGIPSSVCFDPVGETGREIVKIISENVSKVVGGEAVLRIDNRHTVRLSFLSPSSLTAHLSQATLTVSSVPQLCQLLMDEMERCLLQRICDHGRELCSSMGGTWFIDLNRCVGRWEGCVLNFRIFYGKNFTIDCSAFRLDTQTGKQGQLQVYSSQKIGTIPLLSWVAEMIKKASTLS